MDVVFHIGLHKTGTTSLQAALARGRERLLASGILYPALPEGAAFADQHADLALLLRQGRQDDVRRYFRQVAGAAAARPDLRTVIFSAEDLSTLAFQPAAYHAFTELAAEAFPGFRAVMVVRSLVDVVASGIRQRIDGGQAAPASVLAEKAILQSMTANLRKARFLADHTARLTVVDYEEARASGDLGNFLAQACIGPHAPRLESLRLNVSGERDAQLTGLLLAQLRGLLAELQGANPYAAEVNRELAALVDLNALARSVDRERGAAFAGLYESTVRRLVGGVFTKHREEILRAASEVKAEVYRCLLR